MNEGIRINRAWAMPNKNTFSISPIRSLLYEEVDPSKLWIDPFANSSKIAKVTNDLNSEYDTDYHMDALEFLKTFETNSVDGVLFDPPYSVRQVSECYKGVGRVVTQRDTSGAFYSDLKVEISRILKVGGKAICFGWNSNGIGKKYGMNMTRILIVAHGGVHNDTICTVEEKM